MIPSFFVTLERFPLTLNGKIDCKHLPSPNYRANRQYGVEKPSTTQEGILANIWADILKINKVGVNDNFFDLGGHSLLLTNLFHQIEEAFQVKLPISTIFQAGTVKELAKILSQENGLVSSSSLVSLQPKGTNKPLFLIHPCNGEILIYRLLAKKLGPDFPVYGLQAVGLDGQKKPLYSVEEMADNYIKEIQKVQPHGPYYLGGKHIGSMVALEIAQRLISQGQKVELIVVLGGLERLPYQFIDSYRFSANWISLQIKNFKKFGYGYMWEKIKTIINTFSNQSRHNFNVFLSEILSFNHIRIIPEKQTDVELSINEAYLNYKPQAYYGKMIHFQPLENYENLAFKTIFFNSLVDNASKYQDLEYKNLIALGKIFKAGFEINYVPGTDGGNYSAYKESHVDLFAQKLRIALFNSYKMPNKEEVFSTATSSNVEF
jgi:acyl carrier protein